MKNIEYIDNIAKNKLSQFELKPNTDWASFEKKLNNKQTILKQTKSRSINKLVKARMLIVYTAVIALSSFVFININNTTKKESTKKTATKTTIIQKAKKIIIQHKKTKNNINITNKKTTVIIKKRYIVKDTVYIYRNSNDSSNSK